ncbi:hypothetical protein MGH68_01945 [Erysipelothrix sp. D19-032]
MNSQYTKTVYDKDGNITGGHDGGPWEGQSLLIIGNVATVTKSVEQSDGGKPKKNFNMGNGERIVDYVISPKTWIPNRGS